MNDLYAELITNVNKTVDGLENGATVVSKVTNANESSSAERAGNAESATTADSTKNVNIADYVPSVNEMSISLVGSCALTEGVGNCLLGTGIYLVVYERVYTSGNSSLSSCILAIKDNSITYQIPFTNISSGAYSGRAYIEYETATGEVAIFDVSGAIDTNANGTIYFYIIGNTKEE